MNIEKKWEWTHELGLNGDIREWNSRRSSKETSGGYKTRGVLSFVQRYIIYVLYKS